MGWVKQEWKIVWALQPKVFQCWCLHLLCRCHLFNNCQLTHFGPHLNLEMELFRDNVDMLSFVFLWMPPFYSTFQLTLLMSSSLMFLNVVVSSRFAQAPCKHVVEFAQTAVRQNPGSTVAMRELANVRTADAESGCHRVFKKYQLVPSVTLEQASLRLGPPGSKPRKFPYIKLSSWMRHLLETDQLPMQMTGAGSFDTMRVVPPRVLETSQGD